MKYLKTLFLAVLVFLTLPAQALSVVRDAEIEETVTGWVQKIFEAVNLPPENAQIVLINDPSVNAFVAGGQTIFVHTGLFTNATSIDDVMFVLSHETGHIVGGHITRGISAMERTQTATLISTILGGVLAVAAGRPDAGIAVMMGSQGAALGQFLSYRQTEESSADRTAVDVMHKTGYSMQGFENIMQNLRRLERLNAEDTGYLRTHPMTQSRMNDLERFTKNAADTQQAPSFERVKAKLSGFTEKPADVLAHFKGDSFADKYARAIALYRQHKLSESFALLDELIKENPNDAYLYEMKGQFSFEKGLTEQAIENYEKANRLKPHTPLIELALAQSYLEKPDKALAKKALPILMRATTNEPDLALGWRLMATAHNRLGDDLASEYAMAEYERTQDKLKAAQKRAEKLNKKITPTTAYYQKVQDILALKEEK